MPRQLLALLAALIALAGAFGLGVAIDDDGDGKPDRFVTRTVQAAPPAVAVDGPDQDRKADDALPLNPEAQAQLEELTKRQPEDQPKGEIQSGGLRQPNDTPAVTNEGPLASQEFPGCRTRFVANSSSRNGARPRIIVWHQTVSRDRPGRADQDGLTAFANSRSSGVSWHLLVGRKDGLCTFTVPLNLKAWTQGNANPFSFGIEVQAFGDEPTYVEGAGRRRLLAVTRELGRRYNIPMRRGLVQGGRPVRPGIVVHRDLGTFGGGHIDVTSTDRGGTNRWAAEVEGLIAEAGRTSIRPTTTTDRRTCAKLNAWRRAGRPAGGRWERNSVRRRNALTRRDVACTARGPVRK